MKKQIITILCVYLALQGLLSCNKKFLDEKLYSYYAPETLTDSLGFEAAATGLYYQLELFFSKSDAQGWPARAGHRPARFPPGAGEFAGVDGGTSRSGARCCLAPRRG